MSPNTGSPSETQTPKPGSVAGQYGEKHELKRVLGVPSLVFFGLVYMVPLTIFTTYGYVTQLTGGRLPLAYLVSLVVMLFTAVAYGRMSRAFPVAGSAYTYTQKTFGAPLGFLAGWTLLLDYILLPMINYLVIGIYLNAAFPMIPQWVIILSFIAVVTGLNIIGIVSVNRANVTLLVVQVIFILVFVSLAFAALSGSSAVDIFGPFDGSRGEGFPPVIAGAAVLCLSFLGFDSISTMAEEAKEPKKSVPKAIMITTLVAGALFIALALVSYSVFPHDTFKNVDSAALDVMNAAGGQFLATFFTAAYVAGATGSALTSQASVSRILFAMGRDGVLPKPVFGALSTKYGTPIFAILVVAAVSIAAVWIDLIFLFEIISFGALVAFSVVNLTVIKHYFIDLKQRSGVKVLTNVIVPLIGFVLTAWLWQSLSSRALMTGLVWLVIGFVYLMVVTRGFTRKTPTLDMAE